VITEKTGKVDSWHAGDKWAIWDVVTVPILGLGVALTLVFLAARETHRLHRWRTSPKASEPTATAASRGARIARANPGLGGVGALLLLGFFLTLTSALIAPYLWRTGPGDRDGDGGGGDPVEQNGDQGGDREPSESEWGDPEWGEKAKRAVQQAAQSLFMLLLMLLLALLGLLVFGPPLRRLLLLQYLRRPFWPVPPTRRVAQHWRVVEIALGDIGLLRQPGDSATSLARRATSTVEFVDPEALFRCATVADRVAYGLGVAPEDTMLARRTAEMTFETVWDELTESQKFRAMYRWL
jgi:hypothetical protein